MPHQRRQFDHIREFRYIYTAELPRVDVLDKSLNSLAAEGSTAD